MQTKRVIPQTELITLALKNTKPLPSMSSSSLIISRNTPPQSIVIWNKDSSYTTVCTSVTDYCNKPLKSWTKMRANQSQLRKQHIHPTTLQKDCKEISTKTTFVLDVACSGWSISSYTRWLWVTESDHFFAQMGNTWNRNA
jgi:hypothetical protein